MICTKLSKLYPVIFNASVDGSKCETPDFIILIIIILILIRILILVLIFIIHHPSSIIHHPSSIIHLIYHDPSEINEKRPKAQSD